MFLMPSGGIICILSIYLLKCVFIRLFFTSILEIRFIIDIKKHIKSSKERNKI